MSSVDKAIETQLANIEVRAGKSLDELSARIQQSDLTKHGEIRDFLKREHGLGHGDANTLAHYYLKTGHQQPRGETETASDAYLSAIYSGAKADLRPIHEHFMSAIAAFGPFELAPKKTYVSLRREKQFAMIGPATKTRVEVGINAKGLTPAIRLVEMPAGGMCQYKVNLTDIKDVDQELLGWIEQAYQSAG